MKLIASAAVMTCSLAAAAYDSPAHAQTFPVKPIRYVMPTTGASELIGRVIAQGLSEVLGQQVYVDVRAGASGNLGAEIAARAPADGHTVFQVTQAHTANVSLFKNLSYDVLRDFAPITRTNLSPLLVVVHPSLPVKTIADLVRLARAKPGAINYGSAGVGTSTYLAAELFRALAGVDIHEVSYRGGAPAQTAVMTGEVSLYFAPIATVLPYVREGRLRGLAVGAATRIALLPDYPTVAEAGVPDYEASNWHGLVVPVKTPKDIAAQLHSAAIAALKRPEIAKRMHELGLTIVGDAQAEFASFLRTDVEKWRKVIRARGITLG